MKKYCVYKHTCPNGKVYVGITSQNPLRRWNNGKGYHTQTLFYKAILKYGRNNIKHEILFSGLTETQAKNKEIELIALHKSTERKFGYNITLGGESGNGHICSNATRKKLSEKMKGKNTWQKGRKASEETKRKMSEAQKKYLETHTPINTGKHLSKEQKEKISLSLSKAVGQYTLEGKLITKFKSTTEASKLTGVDNSTICRCCKGQRKAAGGYVWGYLNDN